MESSRTKNVSKNTVIALVCQAVNLFLSFLTRTVFIKTLGSEYLGINGLFTNILTILSFAELGIGNALIFSMYKPLAYGDEEKLGSLMALYKKAYIIIGLIIAVVGLAISPFLNVIIKNKPNILENITLLYVLFLLNTVCSYFFTYKKSIIIADQKNYIVLTVTQIVAVLRTVVQITFLVCTKWYLLYLIIQIFCTFAENIVCSVLADRMYPWLKKKAKSLSKEETKSIAENVKALFVYKFGSVILNGTDNILVSAMVGIKEVGLVSNYVLLITSCNAILSKITEAFTASVGNLNATENSEKKYDVFNKLFFINTWLYGFASVGFFAVASRFIEVWVGKDYLLGCAVVLGIVGEFYVKGVHSVVSTYRTTMGFFVEGKWSAISAAALNLVLSVALCKVVGLCGIFLATPLARLLSIGIVDPLLVFKNGFNKRPFLYHTKYIRYLLLNIVIGVICFEVVCLLNIGGWLGVFADVVIVTVIYNLSMFLCFSRTPVFKELLNTVRKMLKF